MSRSRLFHCSIAASLREAVYRINEKTPDMIPHIISIQESGERGLKTTTVVFVVPLEFDRAELQIAKL